MNIFSTTAKKSLLRRLIVRWKYRIGRPYPLSTSVHFEFFDSYHYMTTTTSHNSTFRYIYGLIKCHFWNVTAILISKLLSRVMSIIIKQQKDFISQLWTKHRGDNCYFKINKLWTKITQRFTSKMVLLSFLLSSIVLITSINIEILKSQSMISHK